MTKSLEAVENALIALRKGKLVILCDDASKENASHFVLAAEKATPESLNLISQSGRGHTCLALESTRVDALGLPLMAGSAYTISINARVGITTGSSVQDRARTIKVAIDQAKTSADLSSPGHVFPLKSRPGGVLEKAGTTEGAVDLSRLSGLNPSAILSEILKEDGSLAAKDDLEKLKARLNIPLVSIQDLVHYRLYYEKNVQGISQSPFMSQFGAFVMHTFENSITKKKQTVLIKGKPRNECLVRIHEGCQASESFGFMGCDCHAKLERSLKAIEERGSGILMYYKDENLNMQRCDKRGFREAFRLADAAQILKSLDIVAIRLMTNNFKKAEEIGSYGIQVVERVAIPLSMDVEIFKAFESRQGSFVTH